MRKFFVILALCIAGGVGAGIALKASYNDNAPVTAPSFTESAAPSESVPTTVVDFRKDVTAVHAVRADVDKFPERNTVDLSFTLTNHSGNAATYEVVFSVSDGTGAVVGAITVNTQNAGYPPVKSGGVLKVDGPFGSDNTVPDTFTVAVESVDRIPAA